jgi:hypothetical protein
MIMLTRKEAAKRARICLRTLDCVLGRPNSPRVTRIGRRILIPEASLNEWLISQTA